MIKKSDKKLQFKEGFTLIEMLVAITVLLLSIGGPLTIAAQAVFSSNIARDRLTAAYLAQEAIEVIRHARDSNAINGNSWLQGLSDCVSGNCYIEAVGQSSYSINSCDGTCPTLSFRTTTGGFGYGSGSDFVSTNFIRAVAVEEVVLGQEIRVSSEVRWQAGGRTHNVTLVENLFNWR